MTLNIALVGATGAVGQEMLHLLDTMNIPIANLRCFASQRSQGKTVIFKGEKIPLEILTRSAFTGCAIALLCAGCKISEEWAPLAVQEGALVIDSSSSFRMDPNVPLIIPEINPHALESHHR